MAKHTFGKPKLLLLAGQWHCISPGYNGIGKTPLLAWQDMMDAYYEEALLMELTARQRFMFTVLKNRRAARIRSA